MKNLFFVLGLLVASTQANAAVDSVECMFSTATSDYIVGVPLTGSSLEAELVALPTRDTLKVSAAKLNDLVFVGLDIINAAGVATYSSNVTMPASADAIFEVNLVDTVGYAISCSVK